MNKKTKQKNKNKNKNKTKQEKTKTKTKKQNKTKQKKGPPTRKGDKYIFKLLLCVWKYSFIVTPIPIPLYRDMTLLYKPVEKGGKC